MSSTLRRPIPINEAEAIIDAFWDPNMSALEHYHVSGKPGSRSATSQFWCWGTIRWEPETDAPSEVTLEREMAVEIGDYDRLLVRLAAPPHVRLTVHATIDGIEQLVIADEAARSDAHEFEGAITGQRLEHLRLTITSACARADEAWLYWIGTAHAARRDAMLARPCPYTPDWDGWLLPAETTPEFTPRCGLFFTADDLPAIRRRANSPAYQPLMEHLRETARKAMTFPRTPEEQVGPYLGSGDVWKIHVRERDYDTRSYHSYAPVCAFVGLIDEDAVMLRFAARIAVSLAHTEYWSPHFSQFFPGSTWNTRAFPESFTSAGVALALDWAGGYITEQGENLIRYALATKGVPLARQTLVQHAYMWDSNQSLMIAMGRVLALLVMHQAWPRASAEIEQAECDMYEIFDRYIQADGSSNEGLGYWSDSFVMAMPALFALARYHGKPISDLIPPRFHRMWPYVSAMLSTAGEPASFLPISDTIANSLHLDTISLMAAALGTEEWSGLLGACLDGNTPVHRHGAGPLSIVYGPDEPAAPHIAVPVFARMEVTSMVTSNRPWGSGNVRMHLVGGMAKADHSHGDKGSFILEACGDIFAGDRGMTPYSDATNVPLLKSTGAHNLAVPAGTVQHLPPTADAIWDAHGDEHTLEGVIDTTTLWEPSVQHASRRIHSPSPDRIEIIDEFELDEPGTVSFYLNSPLPVEVNDTTAVIRGKHATLTVTADWVAAVTAEPYAVDRQYTPYTRLDIRSQAGVRHRLLTVLQFSHDEMG